MTSFYLIGQQLTIYVGFVLFLVGLIGSVIQILIFTSVPRYKNIPSCLYFTMASINDCGLLITGLAPYIVTAILNVNINRSSAVWCKLRFFFASIFAAIPLSFVCLSAIDQFFITSTSIRLRQWSNMKTAWRLSIGVTIFWWMHGALWFYFQDLSPITGLCYYVNPKFSIYAILFIFGVLCLFHTSIMITFTILTYRQVQKSIAITRRRFDRQMITMVCSQVFLTTVSVTPYGANVIYQSVTIPLLKSDEQRAIESLVSVVTYMLNFLTYGVRSIYSFPRY